MLTIERRHWPTMFGTLAVLLGAITWVRASYVGWLLSALDTPGWLALGFNIWGNFEIAHKTVRGWLIRILCNAFYLPYCVHTKAWALFWNHVLFAGINVYGWWKWTHEDLQPALGSVTFVNQDCE